MNGVLTNAALQNANLRSANLLGANLRGANLTGANFSFAKLRGANLTGALGFDSEQPGTDYGTGTVLPNGTTRTGRNAGADLAHGNFSRMRLQITNGAPSTRELTFNPGGSFIEGTSTPASYSYQAAGTVATLSLGGPIRAENFTLI